MAQVSYGTITITDTTDIEDIFLIYKGSNSDTTAPSIVWSGSTNDWKTDITQVTGDYIWAITVFKYTGITITSTNYTDYYSSPICLTGEPGISVTGTRELYYLKTNNTNPSQITNSNQITATDRQNGWTSIVPTYVANGTYYTCIETSLSTGGPVWSAPIENKGLTNANAKALDAYNTSTARDTEINAIQAQAKHYWWDSQGAHVAAGTNTTDVNNITQGTPSTYGFNSLMAPGYLALKYKDINFAQLATNSLTFYRPATNGSTYVQGKKGMDLTADALTFYKPLAYNSANEPTAAATLNANGLVLSEGGIKGGQVDSNGFIYLSTIDYPLKNSTITPSQSGLTINGHTPTAQGTDGRITDDYAWRQVIGTKFGVDSEGNLYANNAHLSGATVEGEITATSLIIGNGSDAYNGEAAINASGYDIVIYEDSTDSSIIDHENTTYLYPVMYHNGEIDNTVDNTHYIWFMDNVEPGTTGDATKGGIIASYGHSYRVTYDFDDSAVGTGTLVQERIVDPSKYITKISDTGITIHPEFNTNTTSIQLDGTGLDIIKNGISVAKYSTTARIGQENGSRFLINTNSLQAYSGTDVIPYFEVSANGLSWGSNTAATTAEVNAAAQTATNYLAYDTINGLQIASVSPSTASRKVQILNNAIKIQNDNNNYLNLNSNGMQIYNNGVKIADFNSNIDFFNNLNQKVMSVTQNSIEYYDGGIRRCTIGSTESEHYGFLIGQHNSTSDTCFECEGYIYDDDNNHSVTANINAQSGALTDTDGYSDVFLGLHAYADDGNKYHYLILNASTGGWNGIEASVAITVNSDERLKENICNIGDLSNILFNINPISYSWKDKRTDKQHFGFIAQDVKKALEDKIIGENNFALVEKNKAGYLNLSYTELIPLMIDIIQKHEKRIIELESQLEEK